jgi:hypothetical protein
MWPKWESCKQGFGGEPEIKRQLSRPRHRWEENVTGILQKLEGRVWTGFFWLRIGRSDRLM